MTKTILLAQEFERFVAKLYESLGYIVERNTRISREGFDLLLRSPENEIVIVETKVTRSSVIPRADVLRMIEIVNLARAAAKADRALLVVAGSLANIPVVKDGSIEIVDLRRLRELSSANPELEAELEALVRELAPMPIGEADARSPVIFDDTQYNWQPAQGKGEPLPKGAQLKEALMLVKAGKRGARDFENKCFDALRYLFDNEFANWSKQKVSDGGISRYDVIARISSEHSFWKAIVAYFLSWYVIFEFKNYALKISQGQIYTTEKYLFRGGMRTVAVMISRKGADKNAMAATRGAVREAGKLISSLGLR